MPPINPTAEKALQKNCIGLLEKLGYMYISPKDNLGHREGKTSNILFKDILRKKLSEINHYEYKGQKHTFSETNIARAIDDLDSPLSEGLLVANQKITDSLLFGRSYEEILSDGTKKSFSLRYIDFENPHNNDFYITEEFIVDRANQGENMKTRRVDLVALVNGIPLVAIELKKSSKDYQAGIRQILKEQENSEIQSLFKYIQITIAGNSNEAKYATTGTPFDFYHTWNEENESEIKGHLNVLLGKRKASKLDILLFALLQKERLLKIIKHYTLFDGKIKKICRYQQFFAIEKTLSRVESFDEFGCRQGGLIWHTQGSGKSLTMIMLAKLLKIKFDNAKIIIVTDRIDLDRQIFEVFKKTDIEPKKASSARNLLSLLQSGASVITTLVHKFEAIQDSKLIIKENNIFVLVDESHRTQSGLLHKAMKKVLPQACYLGFTGTPLLKKDKNSFAKFGGEIHRYAIDEAVRDKAVLPLYYEGRMIEQEILNPQGLDRKFELIAKGLSEKERLDLERKWARFSKIASSEQRLELIALDIYTHFKTNLEGRGFKAMLATSSKYEAIKYYEIFSEYYKDFCTAYVISNNKTDEQGSENKQYIAQALQKLYARYGDETQYIEYIQGEFVKGDEIDLLIVVDKLLTGFDAPKARNLYIDKSLKEHSLLQAIARVNRVCEGKDFGYIIDYRGLLGDLDRALSDYSGLSGFDEEDLQQAVIDIREKIVETKTYYTHLESLFSEVKNKADLESYANILSNEEKRKKFKEYLSHFARAFQTALCSEKIDEILSEKEIKEYKDKVRFYNELRQVVQIRYHEVCDFGQYEAQMQKLLDTFVNANGINHLTELVNIFDEDFDKEVERMATPNAKADTILNAISAEIREKMEANPAFYNSLAKQIEHIIKEYEEKRLSEEEKLEKAQQIQDLLKGGYKSDRNYPQGIAGEKRLMAIYDNVCEAIEIEDKEVLANLSLKIDEIYKRYSKKPEWYNSKETENEINREINDELWALEDEHHITFDNNDIEKFFKILRGMGVKWYA
ncbi:type I restriction endonuclease subunit R [Helicobacter didelphidarum]|uniref:Type I restriction enzyme endonuclease subunit n=1 Tax=Helicobacter didelphidarum TaxID=2040648 RepID=A0A3D8IEQ9_9HELI|nr:type I restriction endonuclease subunit R [Helicobacter didelphidarum]RDU63598.1 type I restriction endonuclease subunit R [Helicobacter didelphidarum]